MGGSGSQCPGAGQDRPSLIFFSTASCWPFPAGPPEREEKDSTALHHFHAIGAEALDRRQVLGSFSGDVSAMVKQGCLCVHLPGYEAGVIPGKISNVDMALKT